MDSTATALEPAITSIPPLIAHSILYPAPLRLEIWKVPDSCQSSGHQATELPSSLTHNEEEHEGIYITKIL